MAMFLNLLHRWESAELNQEEAAEPRMDQLSRGHGAEADLLRRARIHEV